MDINYRIAISFLCVLFIVLNYFNIAWTTGGILTAYKILKLIIYIVLFYQLYRIITYFINKGGNKKMRLVKRSIQYIALNVIYSIARRILDDRKKK